MVLDRPKLLDGKEAEFYDSFAIQWICVGVYVCELVSRTKNVHLLDIIQNRHHCVTT